jgi:hypothetical protein
VLVHANGWPCLPLPRYLTRGGKSEQITMGVAVGVLRRSRGQTNAQDRPQRSSAIGFEGGEGWDFGCARDGRSLRSRPRWFRCARVKGSKWRRAQGAEGLLRYDASLKAMGFGRDRATVREARGKKARGTGFWAKLESSTHYLADELMEGDSAVSCSWFGTTDVRRGVGEAAEGSGRVDGGRGGSGLDGTPRLPELGRRGPGCEGPRPWARGIGAQRRRSWRAACGEMAL